MLQAYTERADSRYAQYEFVFDGKPLKMWGRPAVQSDQDIIGMIFGRKMFSMAHMEHRKGLDAYLGSLQRDSIKPVLIDAGGNIGAAALYFNQVYSGLHTIAIEPDPENFRLMQANLAALDAKSLQAALSCRNGTLFLNDIDFPPIGYRVGETGNKEVAAVDVPTLLEGLAPNAKPFILKIDIEGGEDRLFCEPAVWLDEFPLVIIELHDWIMPYTNVSRNFYKRIVDFEFDLVNSGENTFCFNRRLLAPHHCA